MRIRVSYTELTQNQRKVVKRKIKSTFPEAELVEFQETKLYHNSWDVKPYGKSISLTFRVDNPETK